MAVITQPITYGDLREMPDGSGTRYEIIGGELFVTTSPTPAHQRVSYRLTKLFDGEITEPGRGEVFYAPVDVKFSEYDVVVPDLLVVATERRDVIQENFIAGAPGLIKAGHSGLPITHSQRSPEPGKS